MAVLRADRPYVQFNFQVDLGDEIGRASGWERVL